MTSTDYGLLLHAYGVATDTPGHLAALTSDDADAAAAACDHLWSAIIHQGTPWTATPPAPRAFKIKIRVYGQKPRTSSNPAGPR